TCGPRQRGRYGMVIPRFVQQALTEQPITVYGTGKQKRCFGYVGDVVNALITLVHKPEAEGEIFNIGNDEEISIEGLAHLVKELTGSPSSIEYIPYDDAYEYGFEDMIRRVPDLTKIRNLIGYSPKVNLRGLLERVIEYYRACGPGQPREMV
ncbi:MAG: GDP-mannose 4,6-dehydratase, partial [bacterium]|nr:GDP-mannose 4,6-dehydratase [bacterium]